MHQPEMSQNYSLQYADTNRMTPFCVCDNTSCARHGNCRACQEFHRLTNHESTCRYAWHWKKGCEPEYPERVTYDEAARDADK